MKKRNSKKIYVCGVDWQHEVGEASDVRMYASIKKLKQERSCWKECGIVELEVSLGKWIEPQNLYENSKKSIDKNK